MSPSVIQKETLFHPITYRLRGYHRHPTSDATDAKVIIAVCAFSTDLLYKAIFSTIKWPPTLGHFLIYME